MTQSYHEDPSHDHSHCHSTEQHDHHDHNHSSKAHASNGEDHPIEVHRQDHVMRRLKTASALCASFFLVEAVGGYIAGSLAVLSDAAHLLADLASFAVAIAASHLASLPTTDQHTFGLKRMESLAALFSMVCLALVSVGLAFEAVRRLIQPPDQPVNGPLMSWIAAIGVVVNVILALVLGEHHVHMPGASHDHHDHSHSHNHEEKDSLMMENGLSVIHSDELPPPHIMTKTPRNINLHAAYLHVMGDLAQSMAVLIAGIVIWFQPTWQVVDPICTLFFCCIVFYSTLGVLRSSISVLLEEVPPHLNWRHIHTDMAAVDGVTNVHDLHIWSISHGIPTLSVHCTAVQDPQQALKDIYSVCRKHGVVHATIQVQGQDGECLTCTASGDRSCHSLRSSIQNQQLVAE